MQIKDTEGKILFSDDSPTIRKMLENAVKAGANLSRANLSGADLSRAYLSGANLSGANLSGARRLPPAPVVRDIDTAILAAIRAGGKLEMRTWHSCRTTHCRAGWAITLAGEAGAELEKELGPNVAGALIYAASRPGQPVPDFLASNEEAMKDLMSSTVKA